VNTCIAIITKEVGHVILFTRYALSTAYVSIIPELVEKIELLGMLPDFTITRSEVINNKTGSKVVFRGIKTASGDQTASLKSLQGVTTWVLDEAEELRDERIFDKIDLSVRQKDKDNRVILILNPTTKEHFIYNRFFQGKGVEAGSNITKGDTTYIHTTYKDNIEHLSESYLQQIENIRLNNPFKYNHQILGGWLDKAEGVVFNNWKFGEFNPNGLQTSCGMDFGYSVDPDTLVEVAIDKGRKKIYLREHIYEKGLKPHLLAEKILRAVDKKLIIADSAEPRLIDDLHDTYKINIQRVKKGTIESGITMMLDFEIIVEPDSSNIAKELDNHVYADKGSKLYVDTFNHAIDAIRYNVIFHLDNPHRGQYNIR
jgi:phage terminase large subunit